MSETASRRTEDTRNALRGTPPDALQREPGGRRVPFAGYDLPLRFPDGIVAEHPHGRRAAEPPFTPHRYFRGRT